MSLDSSDEYQPVKIICEGKSQYVPYYKVDFGDYCRIRTFMEDIGVKRIYYQRIVPDNEEPRPPPLVIDPCLKYVSSSSSSSEMDCDTTQDFPYPYRELKPNNEGQWPNDKLVD